MTKTLLQTLAIFAALALTNCAHNKNKAEKIDTKIENDEAIASGESLGVKNGNMVVQKKVMMNEEVRRLQYEVYELEDRVYGNRQYGSLGIYGVLKDCKSELSDPANGGDGKLKWTEPIERVTTKEDEFKIGLDDKAKLVGVSEEFLQDRITRFKGYRTVLQGREDELQTKLTICKSDLRSAKAKKN